MLTKRQEIVLKYLLSLERGVDNKVCISRSIYTLEKIPEDEFINSVNYLEQLELINKHWLDIHQRDFNYAMTIELLPKAITYFKTKKINKNNKRKDFIKWLLPLIVSIIALLISLLNFIYTHHLNTLIK